jgi:hypothetical protein
MEQYSSNKNYKTKPIFTLDLVSGLWTQKQNKPKIRNEAKRLPPACRPGQSLSSRKREAGIQFYKTKPILTFP